MKKSISRRIIMVVLCSSTVVILVNMILFVSMNEIVERMDNVYESNVNLNQMSETIIQVESDVFRYLSTPSTDALENYYRDEKDLEVQMEMLGSQIKDNNIALSEKNIRNMLQEYLVLTEDAISAKRGRNIEKYSSLYESSKNLSTYINTYISSLNRTQLENNSKTYKQIKESFHTLEIFAIFIAAAILIFQVSLIILISRRITRPLSKLSKTANAISKGEMDIEFEVVKSKDEIEVMSTAFHKMSISIREHIDKLRESLENESLMKEQSLLMENNIKDIQLKYLRAQINPHFLFNSLNTGMQLAILEDADRTAIFVEKLAEFYRSNINQDIEDTTISQELEQIDNYMFILNVRFNGAIHYNKEVDEMALEVIIPSMILQPLIENAVQHGIRAVEWQGTITTRVKKLENSVIIAIEDTGKGISAKRLEEVRKGGVISEEDEEGGNGIAIDNVIKRIRMRYGENGSFRIHSEGINKGTTVEIAIPIENEEK